MGQTKTLVKIPGLLHDKIHKTLSFENSGLTIFSTLSYLPAVVLPSDQIAAFRYGVKWIRGYKFVFGRQYFIDLQTYDNKQHRIKLGSYYGIRRETYHNIWTIIFKQLWDYYFENMLNYYKELLAAKQLFELSDLKFNETWISWSGGNNLFWNEIGLSNYKTYFAVYNLQNPKQYKSFSFADDWNAFILQCLLKEIVDEQNKFRNTAV